MALSDYNIKATKKMSCKCKLGDSCATCSASGGSDLGGMVDLLGRIRTLTNEISKFSSVISVQYTKIQELECRIAEISGICEDSAVNNRGKRKKVSKKKKVRKTLSKDNGSAGMSSQGEENSFSDSRLNCSALSDRTKLEQRYLSRVNCYYSEDDDSEYSKSRTPSSDCETGKRCKRRRRVKSGAKVKGRV